MKVVNTKFGEKYFPDDPKNKVYAVDVWYTLAKCFRVEASSRDEAERMVRETIEERFGNALAGQAGHVAADMGFDDGEEYETKVSGEYGKDGEPEYY